MNVVPLAAPTVPFTGLTECSVVDGRVRVVFQNLDSPETPVIATFSSLSPTFAVAMRCAMFALLFVTLSLLVGYADRETWRQKMVVEVETPEGIVVGESAVEIRFARTIFPKCPMVRR